jgi:hypothetical protein
VITTPTAFVLGAGASKPYGLPLAWELRRDILEMADGALTSCNISRNDLVNFQRAFKLSSQASVDAFLEYRTEYIPVGKLAIAHCLTRNEKTQNLFSNNPITGDWYGKLWAKMSGPALGQFHQNNVSIITFNYDRSLEHFLFTALKHTFNAPHKVVAEAMQRVKFIHVHGKLGKLPWQSDLPDEADAIPYDSTGDANQLRIAADGIKIIHELDGETPEFKTAKHHLQSSKRIYILGLGYHATNMARLGFTQMNDGYSRYIRGSGLGLTDAEANHVTGLYNCFEIQRERDALDLLRNDITFQEP